MTHGGGQGALVLLADSQLLFPGQYSGALQAWLRQRLTGRKGIYVGAANQDIPDFFELAQAAFSGLGAELHWQRKGQAAPLWCADFYVLAGGDVAEGWRYLHRPPVCRALLEAREAGALFVGISAGAMHLAHALVDAHGALTSYLGCLNAVVAVHEEREQWPTLQWWRNQPAITLPLLTLPMGGALIVTPEGMWQAGKGCTWHERTVSPPVIPWLNPSGLS